MTQPKTPPLSIRPGSSRMAEIDAWATDHGLTRHAAVLALIDLGLGNGSNPVPAEPSPAGPRPSFSHGRSKTAVMETKRTRVDVAPPRRERMTIDDVRPAFVPRLKPNKPKR